MVFFLLLPNKKNIHLLDKRLAKVIKPFYLCKIKFSNHLSRMR